MSKNHFIAIFVSLVIFLGLWLGFDRVPGNQKDIEKSRSLNIEITGEDNILKNAMQQLSADNRAIMEALQQDLDKATADSAKVEPYKALASAWYQFQSPAASAIYADKVAAIVNDAEAWSIAGTTYTLCLQNEKEDNLRSFCSKRALASFEKSLSIDPSNIETRINQALVYVEYPLKEEPMKGILMLRELNGKYPENVAVLNQLARLALQTNQTDKAIERLEKSISLEPENNQTICLLAAAYDQAGDKDKSSFYNNKCNIK
jgi:tetratricopeptide (TPR) repeat protein